MIEYAPSEIVMAIAEEIASRNSDLMEALS